MVLAERGDSASRARGRGRPVWHQRRATSRQSRAAHAHPRANATQVSRESSRTAPAESVNPDVEGGENIRALEGRRSGTLFTLLLCYLLFPPFFSSCSSKPDF